MKKILCYGDSNLWGFIPGSYNDETSLAERYPKNKRWAGILQNKLGETYEIVEEAINGRTTSLDELIPGRPYRNGLTDLPFCLESHYPIDLVILLLGTNDTKMQYSRSAEEIGESIQQLVQVIKKSHRGPNGEAPKILIIAPQPIIKSEHLHDQYNEGSIEKSKKLATVFQTIAESEGCEFLDAASYVTSSELDGVHLDDSQCELLGNAVVEKVRQLF